jgi:O-antigen/teichoic acid export membrane protein
MIGFLFPVISELSERKQINRIQIIHGFFSSYASVFILWFSGAFIILGSTLAIIFFGEGYYNSGKALLFIGPFLILGILIQINFQIMR